ncbi:hypothetical protein B9Z55_027056 [Caenorhabditis nigoni]|uniref:Domain of unknown function WSN domain-containing protein n=1 Tax=Caenorhabditis nigoni TaxID=1611254 RepID=A0A2G5SIP2_9PELO|nr:hypothetical protein B9Z55_027056 [Caenorhabditis nigoni]PIC14908.1 hypothetical protein B9Z55_027056 [Caenorhabditis nigoni]
MNFLKKPKEFFELFRQSNSVSKMRIACVLWILFIELVKSFDDDINTSWNRFDRAAPTPKGPPGKAPPTGKPKNSSVPTGPSLPSIVSRHMKLAPIFNALYIDIELSKGQIDAADVVAGLWNLKDKTVLNKLVSLDNKQLSTMLNTLDEKIKKVPAGLTQIADVDAISEKMGKVDVLKDRAGREVFQSASKGNVPKFIRDKTYLGDLASLKVDPAQQVLQNLSILESLDSADSTAQLNTRLATIPLYSLMRWLAEKLPLLMKNLEDTQIFSDSLTTASILNNNVVDIVALTPLLTSVKTGISSIPLANMDIDIVRPQKFLEQIAFLISELNTPADGLPIDPGLGSRINSTIASVLQDKTLRQILNNGKKLDGLESALATFTEFTRKLPKIEKQKNVIFEPNNFITVMYSLKVLKDIGSFQQLPDQDKFTELTACLTSQAIDEPDGLDVIRNHFDNFLSGLQTVQSKIPSTLNATKKSLSKIDDDVLVLDDDSFADFKEDPVLATLKTALAEMSENFFKPISTEEKFYEAVEAFLDKNILDTFEKSEEWISKVLAANTLHHEKCQFIFQFDNNTLTKLNKLPKIIYSMKTQKPAEKLKPFLQAIPLVKSGLEDFSEIPSSKNQSSENSKIQNSSKNMKKLKITNPENLLTVAHAIRSLEKINEIHNLDKELATVIQQGDIVLAVIGNVSNPINKEMLEKIWKNFPVIKGDMIRLKKKILEAIKVIKPQDPEKNLEDVGKVYESIRKFSFNERIDLRPFRKSLDLFDAPGFPEMQTSLKKLEDPYFGNWWEAHKSFQKAQKALKELQWDFEQFFGPKDVERERDEQSEYILSWMWTLSTIIFFEFCTLMALCAINKCLGFDELVKELDGIKNGQSKFIISGFFFR